MLSLPCDQYFGYAMAQETCTPPLIRSGTLVAPPESVSQSNAVGQVTLACDPTNFLFPIVCRSLSAVFTVETINQIGQCAASSCSDIRDCLLDAHCPFLFDNIGALPNPPLP